jgi:hypothetical protein
MITYPPDKGSFRSNGVVDCVEDDGVTPSDDGSGTLTIAFSGIEDTSVDVTCTFHLAEGQTLTDADLVPTVDNSLEITIDLL